jgi:hypothetical protein
MILLFITLAGAALRFFELGTRMMFIGDQSWFYLSARDALLQGHFPWLGITSSITWLHQGALYTYLLVPALLLSNFHPVSGAVLSALFGTLSIPLSFYLAAKLWGRYLGFVMGSVVALLPFSVLHSRFAYHTSPLILFEILLILFFIKRRLVLAFLFLGLLYQLHLLTFIFWPLVLFYMFKHRLQFKLVYLFAFGLGIFPFFVSGPIQTLGIFAWIGKNLLVGFPHQDSFSEAYRVVIFIPVLLLAAYGLTKLPRAISSIFLIVFICWSLTHQIWGYGSSFQSRLDIASQILGNSAISSPEIIMEGDGSQFESAKLPYEYLTWWLQRQGNKLGGRYARFQINDQDQTVKMLE